MVRATGSLHLDESEGEPEWMRRPGQVGDMLRLWWLAMEPLKENVGLQQEGEWGGCKLGMRGG